MCKLFEDWSEEIRQYCITNGLSYEKARNLSQCWGSNFLALQFYDPNQGRDGLLNETPMPLVLLIKKTAAGLEFEQTEFTHTYLAS